MSPLLLDGVEVMVVVGWRLLDALLHAAAKSARSFGSMACMRMHVFQPHVRSVLMVMTLQLRVL